MGYGIPCITCSFTEYVTVSAQVQYVTCTLHAVNIVNESFNELHTQERRFVATVLQPTN